VGVEPARELEDTLAPPVASAIASASFRISAALASARNSRRRERLILRRSAANGARTKPTTATSATRAPPLRERPPYANVRSPRSATSAITPANTTAMVMRYVSRLRMCETSCASTASSSRLGIVESRPVVTPT
jgi:hypothetical protein